MWPHVSFTTSKNGLSNPVCLEHFVPHLHLHLVQSTCDQIRQMLDPGVNEVLDSDIITQTHKTPRNQALIKTRFHVHEQADTNTTLPSHIH